MKYRSMSLAVVAAALFSGSLALAADAAKPAADQPAAATPKAAPADAAPASSSAKPAPTDAGKPATTDAKKSTTPAAQSKPAEASKTKAGSAAPDATKSQAKPKATKPKTKPIDINNASAEELKKIPGVGDAEAERIIKARPYPTRSHLVDRNVLTLEQYYAMKDYMIAVQPDPKASKTSTSKTSTTKK